MFFSCFSFNVSVNLIVQYLFLNFVILNGLLKSSLSCSGYHDCEGYEESSFGSQTGDGGSMHSEECQGGQNPRWHRQNGAGLLGTQQTTPRGHEVPRQPQGV